LYLASDVSAVVTGMHLPVDGGMLVGPHQAWDPMMQAERQREVVPPTRPRVDYTGITRHR
jgi:hypothetical protein